MDLSGERVAHLPAQVESGAPRVDIAARRAGRRARERAECELIVVASGIVERSAACASRIPAAVAEHVVVEERRECARVDDVQQYFRRGLLALAHSVHAPSRLQRRSDIPEEVEATAEHVIAALLYSIEPVHIAVAIAREKRRAGSERIGQRQVDAAGQIAPRVGPDRAAHLRPETISRCTRRDIDRTADRVATEQRALRAPQHFHSLQIEQFDQRADRAAVVRTVHVQPDARLGRRQEVVLTYAANEHDGCGRRARAGAAEGEIHIGREIRDCSDLRGAALRELCTADRGDRDGCRLQAFLRAPRGHGDFLQSESSFALCPRRRRQQRARDESQAGRRAVVHRETPCRRGASVRTKGRMVKARLIRRDHRRVTPRTIGLSCRAVRLPGA